MILSGSEIKKQVKLGNIAIEDFNESRVGPNSYNLRLAPELVIYKEAVLDPKQENRTEAITIPPEGIVIHPGRVYLAKTMEWTETHTFVPLLVGRSSVGRLGVSVHVTAGFGDVGFCGNWTMEITCEQVVKLYPEMEICQIYYHPVCGEISGRYSGKYQNSKEVIPSRLSWEMGRDKK